MFFLVYFFFVLLLFIMFVFDCTLSVCSGVIENCFIYKTCYMYLVGKAFGSICDLMPVGGAVIIEGDRGDYPDTYLCLL